MDLPAGTDTESRSRIRQQGVVAELGKRALETDDLDRLLRDAAAAVAETLDVEVCGVFELLSGGDDLGLRGGVGWQEGEVGSATVRADRDSAAGHAVVSGNPVVGPPVPDDRFSGSELLDSHDIASGVSVVVGTADDPWGVLGVYATESREFADHDVEFVRDVADVLGSAVENRRSRAEREEMYGHISDGFFALDEEWNFTHLNDRAHELINPEGQTLEGENVWEEFPEAVGRKFKDEYERAMYDQETVSFEEYYPDPLNAWFEVRAFPSETGLSVYFRDISDRKERERTLEEYEAIVRSAADGVYVLDDDHRFQVVNDAFVEMTGYSREELLGSDAAMVSTGEGHERGLELREQLRSGEREVAVLEEKIQTADGSFVESEIRFVPLQDDDGEFRGTAGVVRDVSEHERTRRQLEDERDMFAQGPAIVFRWKNEEGWPVEYVSENVEDVLGYTTEELESGDVPYTDLLLDEEIDRIAREVEENSDDVTERFSHDPYRIRTGDGDVRWVKDATKIVRDDTGDITHYLGYLVDITDRKERERELQRKERRFEAVFEDPNILVGLLDPDGTVLDINTTAMEYIESDLDEVTGEPFWETPWWGKGDGVQSEVREWTERAAAGEYVDFEADLTRPDGQEYTLSGYFRPVTDDDGEVVSIIVSDRDVTERKRFEGAIRALHETSRELFRAGSSEEVGHLVATAASDVLGLSDCVLYLHDEERGDLYPAAEATEVGVLWDDLPRVTPGDDTIVGHAYATGESVRWDDIRDSPHFIGSDTEMRSGVYAPVGDHGVVFTGSSVTGAFDDRTLQLLELLAANAEAAFDRVERERALEESERRYRILVDHFPDGAVGLFDENQEYTAVGGEMLDEVGVSVVDRIGNSVYDIYPDDVVEEVEPYFEAALDGESSEFEVNFHDRHLRARTLPVGDAADEIVAGMLVVQDVTEREEQRRELRERERRLEQYREYTDHVLDAIDDVFYLLDEDGELVRWNESLGSVTGYSEGEIAGMDAVEFFDDETRDEMVAAIRDGFETGTVDIELELLTKSGEHIPYEFSGSPLEDPWGNPVLAGIGRDVTGRKERERELERVLDLLERTERIADVGGWEVDPDTKEPYWSDHLFDLLDVDYDDQPTLDQALDVYYTEEDRAIVEDAVEEAFDSGEPFDVVTRFPRPEGDVGRLRVQGEPEVEDGEVVSLRGAVQDVTERKERERQLEELVEKLQESNERLEQFAYAASHDLQEPLRMVSSYLQLLDRRYGDALDEEGEEFLEFAVGGADRMRDMIAALLEYSRIETRGDPFEPVDLDAVLDDVLADLQVRVEETDAEVTTESLPRVEGDANQLRQLFQNLLDNALTYSGDAPPRVEVQAERRGGKRTISVIDEGVGIDPGETDAVFEVFQRLHSRDEYAGTGIGLALCQRIVERHGGEIWVESQPGEGSTFSLTLPAAGDHDE